MIYDSVAEDAGWLGFKQNRLDAFALETCILEAGNGDYLEVGVRLGGSALFAAIVKSAAKQSGEIYGIDLFNLNPSKGVTPEAVLRRFSQHGMKINLTVANSNPWPLPDIRPVVALIDGSHNYEPCLSDWNNLKTRAERFILFHDYKTDKRDSVYGVIEIAKQDPNWHFIDAVGWMAIFERYHKAQ